MSVDLTKVELIANRLYELGYRTIPNYDNYCRSTPEPFGAGQVYPPGSREWKNADFISVALDRLILVDIDGNKAVTNGQKDQWIKPHELAKYIGISPEYMEKGLFQWNQEMNSLHFIFRWPESIPFKKEEFHQSRDGELEINDKQYVDIKTGNQLVHIKPHKCLEYVRTSDLPEAPPMLVELFRKKEITINPPASASTPILSCGGTPYGLSALRGASNDVRLASIGQRNSELNKQSFVMGSLVAGGELSENVVRYELEEAANHCGLGRTEILRTISSGIASGMQKPRMPELQEHTTKVGEKRTSSNVVKFPEPASLPENIVWPSITPLYDELSPVLPITPEMIPNELRGWLVDICERMDSAPFEFAAVSAVVVMGSLIGRKVGIYPKALDDWRIVPNVWGAIIGRPSMKKSPVAKEVIKTLNDLEKGARNRFNEDMKAHEAENKIEEILNKDVERKASALVKQGKIDEARLLLADNAATQSTRPIPRRYIVNDATVEKLGVILAENPQGLLLFRDELSGWLLGLKREDRQQERAFYLEAWNGNGSFSYDRIGREDVFMKSTTTAVLGGIQPGKLLSILASQMNGAGDDGLVERLQLAVYPDKPTFKYVDRPPNEVTTNQAKAVFERLDSIPFDVDQEAPTQRFTTEAQKRFSQWYIEINEHPCTTEMSPVMESHIGKYPSLIPALALIFHIVDNDYETPVTLEALEMAIQWGKVLETHAQRIYGLVDNQLAGAKVLLGRLSELPSPFKKRSIVTKHWTLLADSQAIDKALSILVNHGYLLEVTTPPAGGKGRPSVDYWVNPNISEE